MFGESYLNVHTPTHPQKADIFFFAIHPGPFSLPNSQVPSWLYKSALHQPCESWDFIGFTSEEPPSVTEQVASLGLLLPNTCGWKNSRNFVTWDKNADTEEKGKSSFRKATLPSKQYSEHVLCVRWAVETPGN